MCSFSLKPCSFARCRILTFHAADPVKYREVKGNSYCVASMISMCRITDPPGRTPIAIHFFFPFANICRMILCCFNASINFDRPSPVTNTSTSPDVSAPLRYEPTILQVSENGTFACSDSHRFNASISLRGIRLLRSSYHSTPNFYAFVRIFGSRLDASCNSLIEHICKSNNFLAFAMPIP